MLDVHHHLIWGVDDGPQDLKTSIAMARMAIDDGVTHIVCTPHASDVYPYQKELVEERFAELRQRLAGQVELSLACDLHLTADNVLEAQANFPRYSINGKGYLMVEFDSHVISPMMDEALFRLHAAGYQMIVTHPERYEAVLRKPERIAQWMEAGYLIQVTAASFFGRFGRAAESLSHELLERDWIHFLASDAHNLTSRRPRLKKIYDYVAHLRGEETARRLLATNPEAAILGRPWPAQPEPVGLREKIPLRFHLARGGFSSFSGENVPRPSPKKSLWQRLFSR